MIISVSFRTVKGITILALAGRLLGEELEMVAKEVENRFAWHEKAPPTFVAPPTPNAFGAGKWSGVRLIVDLSRVEYTGSQGISMLVALSQKYQVKLAAPQPPVRDVLNLLNINKIIEIYETVDEAIEYFT